MNVRECSWCGVVFEPNNSKHRACSNKCKNAKGRYDRKLSGHKRVSERRCFVCGETFKLKTRGGSAKTCSVICSREIRNLYCQTERAKRMKKIGNDRRYLLTKQNPELRDEHRARNRMSYANNREKWRKYSRDKQLKVMAAASALGGILDMRVTNYNKYTLYLAYQQLTGEK